MAGLGPGWRISAWTASTTLAVFGIVSTLFPDPASSVGVGWGVLAVLAAAAIAAEPVLERRRGRAGAGEGPAVR